MTRDLLGEMSIVDRSATFDPSMTYRYELRRVWLDTLPLLPVCMLNPSTADASVDDPTILTMIHFAKLWGYGGLLIVNLFAFRSPSPDALKRAGDAMGEDNGSWVMSAILYARENGGRMLAAWGNGGDLTYGQHDGKASLFCRLAAEWGISLICLGLTQSGAPKHPMARGKYRIPRDQQPIEWSLPS